MPTKAHVLGIALSLVVGCGNEESTPAEGEANHGDPLLVTTDNGPVRGDQLEESRRFLAIFYAKPPVGPLRWAAPQKPEPWSEERHAVTFASPCPQQETAQAVASNQEDCLYLNVWAPAPATAPAPVLVWFHGGGNRAGSAADTVPIQELARGERPLWYDGQFFVKNHGIVVVTLNYRLGPLGFFAHPALAAEGEPRGNQGLLDQRLALEWVRDNIAAFGGDPANVTIFGESAGSADVCFHVVSPGSNGLFHRAISQSGGCTARVNGKNPTTEDAQAGLEAFAAELGCGTAPDPLPCLRSVSVDALLANAGQTDLTSGTMSSVPWSFTPVVGDAQSFLPDQPTTLFAQGKVSQVPYILGSNHDEGTLFTFTNPVGESEAAYLEALTKRFGDFAPQVAAAYPMATFGSYAAAFARVVGDAGLVCGTHDTARYAARAGLPVFLYNFNVAWNISSLAAAALGATHAAEISHVFGSPIMPDEASQRVADAMHGMWVQFARTGDPNGGAGSLSWPLFDATSDQRLEFASEMKAVAGFRKAECDFWRASYGRED